MYLTVRLLGIEVLHIDLGESDDGVPDRGDLGSSIIDAGKTDLYLGFSNGMADE